MEDKTIIGLDVGGSKIAIVRGLSSGTVISRREIATNAEKPFQDTYLTLEKEIREVIGEVERDQESVSAISVAIGGPLKIEEGFIINPPHLPGWHGTPLKTTLEDSFNLPVFVEHDGNAGALAEFHFGAGKGARNLIFLTAGTGLGAGIIIDGKIYRGASDVAGEVGHVRMSDDGPESYGKKGSWEGWCSASGLLKLAHMRFPGKWSDSMTPKEFFDIVLAGDSDAVAVVNESGEWLGKGLSILVDVLNPDTIVVGSMGRVLGDIWLQPAREVVVRECLKESSEAVKIIPAKLGKEIGDIASLMGAISKI